MAEQEYSDTQLLKVMLEVAKRKRSLTNLEKEYDSRIDSLSESRKSEIISYMVKNNWISSHPVFFDQPQTAPNTSVKIFPMTSNEGEGLSPEGEDRLKHLISLFENKRKEKRTRFIYNVLKWIFGIITTLLIAFIVWKLGWNK